MPMWTSWSPSAASSSRIASAALTARSGSSSCATGAPKIAITASPTNFATVPPCRSRTERRWAWYGCRSRWTSSGSICSERAVNPTRSANSTVTTLRSWRRGRASPSSGEPQALQNRAPAGLSCRQTWHVASRKPTTASAGRRAATERQASTGGPRSPARELCTDSSGLLGEADELGHVEAAVVAGQWWSWPEVGLHAQIGQRVVGQDAQQHLSHDPPPNRTELQPLLQDFGLFEDVEPQGRVQLQVLADVADGELVGGERLDAHRPGYRRPGRQTKAQPTLEVASGQRWRRIIGDGGRQGCQGAGQRRVDQQTRLGLDVGAGHGEQELPLHRPLRREPAKAIEVRQLIRGFLGVEDRDGLVVARVLDKGVDVVAPANHRMAEPVGGHGELDWHEGVVGGVVELELGSGDRELDPAPYGEGLGPQDVIDHRVANHPAQEVVHDDPLVVPADQPLGLFEQVVAGQRRGGRHVVDNLVVELQHGQVQLGDQQVLVVAGIAEQRPAEEHLLAIALAGFVAGQVRAGPALLARDHAHILAELQSGDAAGLFVQVWLVAGAAAIDRVQIEPGGAEVVQGVGVVLALKAGHRIKGDVVIDELTQIGVPGGNVGVLRRRPTPGNHSLGQLR